MNLKESLPDYYSAEEFNKIIDWINGSPEYFGQLMTIFLKEILVKINMLPV
jgi:hypothetical protein